MIGFRTARRRSRLDVRYLVTKRTNKLHSPELKTIFNENDIVFLTETWTNELCDIHIKHFELFVLNRTENKKSSKRSSGGIIVYAICNGGHFSIYQLRRHIVY